MSISCKHTTRFAILLSAITVAFCSASFIPYEIKSFSYAITLSIKEVLVFALPFIVFSIVFRSASKLQGNNAVLVVLMLLAAITLSNSASVFVAHFVAKFGATILTPNLSLSEITPTGALVPFFSFKLPSIISSIKAVALGFLCGVVMPKMLGKKSEKLSEALYDISVFSLEKVLTPILPIFVVGLVFKMHSDNLIGLLMSNAKVALLLFSIALVHIFLLYFIASGFSIFQTLARIRDMLPTSLFAFTTMSSLITMPVVLSTVKKSSRNHEIMDITVPTSLNVHLVGDCFFLVVMSIVIAAAFNVSDQISTWDYAYFLLYFIVSKFAVVAIPGGGIIIMLPIIEEYLHFSPTMLSLMTTLYFVFDPIITVVNVLGNGAFAMLFSKMYTALFTDKKSKKSED